MGHLPAERGAGAGSDTALPGGSQGEGPITFVSYSRHQLYFAESIALHLQKHGLRIWFDLQQLKAGTVWEDGLKHGVRNADRLVLIVSRAALESEYTRAEWAKVVERGDPVVLVLFEPVDLPRELQGLPTYDFRSGFDRNLRALLGYLNGEADPHYDPVPAPNRFGLTARLPGAIWLTLIAQFGCLFLCVLCLNVAVFTGRLREALSHPVFWILAAVFFALGARYAIPLLHHKLPYRKVKRSVFLNVLFLVPTVVAMVLIFDVVLLSDDWKDFDRRSYLFQAMFVGVMVFLLYVRLHLCRRSDGLLRWMPRDDSLQGLRRRAHAPVAAAADSARSEGEKREARSVAYAIHADPADKPFARYVDGLLGKGGHHRVAEGEEAQQHIAILSNRSSEAWAHGLAQAHAGKLIFVVASTIEFSEGLKEVGRYQWVDARDMNRREIVALARSLAHPEAVRSSAALETTPALIDHWKVPAAVTVLKGVLEWLGIYLLIFSVTDLIGSAMDALGMIKEHLRSTGGNAGRSGWLFLAGATSFALASRGLVQRKVPGPVLFGILIAMITVVGWNGELVMQGLKKVQWFPAGLLVLVVLYCWFGASAWLPAFGKPNADEVGIKKSIGRRFRIKRIVIVAVAVFIILGLVVTVLLTH